MTTVCKTCVSSHIDEQAKVRVCRRFPPTAQQVGAQWTAAFPPVLDTWGCGEHKPKEIMFVGEDLIFHGRLKPPKPIWTPAAADPGPSKPEPQESYDIPDHIRTLAKELADRGDEPDDWLDYVPAALELWAKIKPVDNAKPPIDAA